MRQTTREEGGGRRAPQHEPCPLSGSAVQVQSSAPPSPGATGAMPGALHAHTHWHTHMLPAFLASL